LGSPFAEIEFEVVDNVELNCDAATVTSTTPDDDDLGDDDFAEKDEEHVAAAGGLFLAKAVAEKRPKTTKAAVAVKKKRKASACEATTGRKTTRTRITRSSSRFAGVENNVTSPGGWPPTGTACEVKFDDVWWSGIVTSYPVPLYPGSSTVKIILDEDPGRICVLYTDVDEGYFRILARKVDEYPRTPSSIPLS
jgi:hypothetical protein